MHEPANIILQLQTLFTILISLNEASPMAKNLRGATGAASSQVPFAPVPKAQVEQKPQPSLNSTVVALIFPAPTPMPKGIPEQKLELNSQSSITAHELPISSFCFSIPTPKANSETPQMTLQLLVEAHAKKRKFITPPPPTPSAKVAFTLSNLIA